MEIDKEKMKKEFLEAKEGWFWDVDGEADEAAAIKGKTGSWSDVIFFNFGMLNDHSYECFSTSDPRLVEKEPAPEWVRPMGFYCVTVKTGLKKIAFYSKQGNWRTPDEEVFQDESEFKSIGGRVPDAFWGEA